jgi:hypothetical protein
MKSVAAASAAFTMALKETRTTRLAASLSNYRLLPFLAALWGRLAVP